MDHRFLIHSSADGLMSFLETFLLIQGIMMNEPSQFLEYCVYQASICHAGGQCSYLDFLVTKQKVRLLSGTGKYVFTAILMPLPASGFCAFWGCSCYVWKSDAWGFSGCIDTLVFIGRWHSLCVQAVGTVLPLVTLIRHLPGEALAYGSLHVPH